MKAAPFHPVVFCLVLVCGLFAGRAHAQFLTHDASNDDANFLKTIEQYKAEIDHYQQVITHYQQQLISLQQMNFGLPGMETSYTRISDSDASQQASDECPDTTTNGNPVFGLLQLVTPDMNQSVISEQRKFCRQIVLHRINKYNLSVDMMNRLNGTYAPNLQSIYNQFVGGGDKQGAMDGTKANAEANMTALDTEMKLWQGQLGAEDQIITYDQSQVQLLGKKAMDGNNTIIGSIVQMAALKAALSTVGK